MNKKFGMVARVRWFEYLCGRGGGPIFPPDFTRCRPISKRSIPPNTTQWLLQKAVEILPGDTPEVLQKRVMEQAEWKLLPEAVSLFCQGRLHVEGRIVRIDQAE